MSREKSRVEWLDAAKAIAIFAVYLWHFGEVIGPAFNFIIWFHVPLFFFLSGCAESFNPEKNIVRNFVKSVKSIIIPTVVFLIISLCIYVIKNILINHAEISILKSVFIQIAKGMIRNNFFAFSLWFFTCLFVIKIMFSIIKLLKFKPVVLAIGIVMYYIANVMIHPSPIFEPHMPYNVDSAFFYMIYYTAGYVAFPYIEKLLRMDSATKKRTVAIAGLASLMYAVMLFLGKDVFKPGTALEFTPVAMVYRAGVIIILVIILAYLLRRIKLLAWVGESTLYLCGNEYVIKEIIPLIIGIFGLKINYDIPAYLYVYTIVLIASVCLVLMPVERYLIKKITDRVF